MTASYAVTDSVTFTLTHAKHLAAKVATDLKRIQRFYGAPSDLEIARYEEEIVLLLKAGYLATVTYGFWRNGAWIEPALRYAARDLAGAGAEDDDPGRVRPGAETRDAKFYSYLTYSSAWTQLSETAKEAFKKQLPFQRAGAPEPAISGSLTSDRTYSAAGVALDRSSVRAL